MRLLTFIFNNVIRLYTGKSNFFLYVFVGFLLSITLGLSATRTHGRLEPFLAYGLDFSPRVVIYGALAGVLTIITIVFLIFISVGIVRYFRSHKGIARWVLLTLGLLHLPISLMTIVLDAGNFIDSMLLTISNFQISS